LKPNSKPNSKPNVKPNCKPLFAALAVFGMIAAMQAAAFADGTFRNPILYDASNPFITNWNGSYYAVHTRPDYMGVRYVSVRKAQRLDEIQAAREVHVLNLDDAGVPATLATINIWAPEMWRFKAPDGSYRWYMYLMAASRANGWAGLFVFESESDDPQSHYAYKGALTGGDPSAFAAPSGQLYYLYCSGSPEQNYIRKMDNPWTLSSEPAALITWGDQAWERNLSGAWQTEGPIIMQKDGRTFVFYSGSTTSSGYAVGAVYTDQTEDLTGAVWTEYAGNPILTGAQRGGVALGGEQINVPGHNGLFKSPDGTEDWIVYQAKALNLDPSNPNQSATSYSWYAQPIEWIGDPDAPGKSLPAKLTLAGYKTYIGAPSGEPDRAEDPDEIIVDNVAGDADGNAFATNFTTRSVNSVGYYGDDYYVTNNTAQTATWTPNIPSAGYYDVYMTWNDTQKTGSLADRTSAAPVTIRANGQEATVTVDQCRSEAPWGGPWLYVGTYEMSEGKENWIRISSGGSTSARYTVADAVRLVRVKGWGELSSGEAAFDRNAQSPGHADVTVGIAWNGAKAVSDVKANGASIGAGNYSVSEDRLAVRKGWLAEQEAGTLALSVEFAKADPTGGNEKPETFTPAQAAALLNAAAALNQAYPAALSITITDSPGLPTSAGIAALDGGGAKASYAINNMAAGAPIDALCVFAEYSDAGALKSMAFKAVRVAAGESAAAEILAGNAQGKLKAFIWDAATYAPLCESATATAVSGA
jgi:GH43 family beta-xylosidase